MPTAHEIATEFRMIADHLDREPEAPLSDLLIMDTVESKDVLLAYARLMPRPLTKEYKEWCSSEILAIEYKSPVLRFLIHAPRNLACRLVRPAEYDCEPLLSEEEDAAIATEEVQP